MMGTRHSIAVLTAALLVTACSGQGEPERTAQDAPEDSTATSVSTAEPEAGATSAPPAAGASQLVPIEWPDAPRELTEVEQEFMFEPGPFAGDAYDEDAAYEAVLASDAETTQEWQEAIQAQIQGDYADDVKAAILFDPSLSEGSAEPTEGDGPEPEEEQVGTNHFAIVLDASGSMAAQATDGTRMEEATAAVADFAEQLPSGSTVSLRVYGHEGDNSDAGKQESCASSEVVFEGEADDGALGDVLSEVSPVGWTPLAMAVEDAANDIPDDATDGIVYVVTDGLESCGGDPVEAAGDLAATGIEPIVNVIGFQVGDADQEALRAMAEAGGGEFTAVGSGAELEEYWTEEYSRMMDAWSAWRRAELDRITAEGRANMTEATDVGRRLMDGATEEGRRAQDLANRLKREDAVDYDTGNAVWMWAYDRKNAMWNWAYERKNSNWSAAYDEKNTSWTEAYNLGNSKWSEYYEKKYDN